MDIKELDRRRSSQTNTEYLDRIIAAPIHPSLIRARKETCEAIIPDLKDLLKFATEDEKPDLLTEIERYEDDLAKCEAELAALPLENEPAPNRDIEPSPEKAPIPEIHALVEEISESKASDASDQPGPGECPAVFRKLGQTWMLSFAEKTVHIPHLVGLDHIAELLRTPRVPIDAAQLAGVSIEFTNFAALPGIPMADDAAIKDVRRELSKKKAELVGLPQNDWLRREPLKGEIEKIEKYLSQVEAHRGQLRIIAGTAQRSRASVTTAINRAIKRISSEHPVLAGHLKASISTGIAVIYAPNEMPEWQL